jgi:hypothetical protein
MILLSLFSVSCSNNNIEKENEKDTIEYIDWKKNKALWGEVSKEGDKIIISEWNDNKAPLEPKFIK